MTKDTPSLPSPVGAVTMIGANAPARLAAVGLW